MSAEWTVGGKTAARHLLATWCDGGTGESAAAQPVGGDYLATLVDTSPTVAASLPPKWALVVAQGCTASHVVQYSVYNNYRAIGSGMNSRGIGDPS